MARTKSYPGSIQRRNGAWRVRLCVAGKYHHFTVGGTKQDAQNFATAKHAELERDAQRSGAGLPGPIRVSALLNEFEELELPTLSTGSVRSYGNSLAAFRAYFVGELADPVLRAVTRGHVKTFMQWRRTRRVLVPRGPDGAKLPPVAVPGATSGHTVARDRRVLHRLFNYAIERDHIEANPAARVRAPKTDPRNPPILTDAQLDALLEACASNPMLRLYALLLAETGCRAFSEALQLRWEDVDLQRGFLHIRSAPGRRTKSGRSRHVPLTDRLRAELAEHAAHFRLVTYDGRRSPFVFHHTRRRRGAEAGARVQSMRTAFEGAVRAAKLPDGFRLHDLRHRRATTWLAAGGNPVHVKDALGHASLATTMGYTHLLPEHLRALVEAPPKPNMSRSMSQP